MENSFGAGVSRRQAGLAYVANLATVETSKRKPILTGKIFSETTTPAGERTVVYHTTNFEEVRSLVLEAVDLGVGVRFGLSDGVYQITTEYNILDRHFRK